MKNPFTHKQTTEKTHGIMVQSDLSETALVSKSQFKSETEPLVWSDVLDKLLPQRPIGSERNPKFKAEGCVDLWREWDQQSGLAIWSKTYLGNHELAAFNQWEFALLAKLSDNHVAHTYRAKEMVRVSGTFLSLQDSEKRNTQHLIKTKNEGPTLSDWLRIPVHSGKGLFVHGLIFPANYLTMALELLRALEGIHENNLVHCDLHPGNVCINARSLQPPTDSNGANTSSLSFQLEFDKLTLIDFGYSIDRTQTPPCMLPFGYGPDTQISPHLKKVLAAIEMETRALLKERGEHREWESVQFDQGFWQRYPIQPSPLEKLKSIDWREDLYRLGRLLADIRDGEEGRIIPVAQTPEVEALISSLPEELISWGSHGVGEAAPEKPHRDYIRRIDDALTRARTHGEVEVTRFTTNSEDYDAIQFPSQQLTPAAVPLRQSSAPETLINKRGVIAQQQDHRWKPYAKIAASILAVGVIAWGVQKLSAGHKEVRSVDTTQSIAASIKPITISQQPAEKAQQENANRQKAEKIKEEQRLEEVARQQELQAATQAAKLAATKKEQAQTEVVRSQQTQQQAQKAKVDSTAQAKSLAASRKTAAPAQHYVISGDGTEVTDPKTSLIWRRCAEGMEFSGGTCTGKARKFTYDEALRHAQAETVRTGIAWRVPKIEESFGIVDKNSNPSLIAHKAFPAMPSDWFWSASPFAGTPGYFWAFSDGDYNQFNRKSDNHYVRFVRGIAAALPLRYVTSIDGAEVADKKTGLIWRRCAEGMVYGKGACTGKAIEFDYGNLFQHAKSESSRTGVAWRVPTNKELSSIIDKQFVDPSIDSTVFPTTPSNWFWTASQLSDIPYSAPGVCFSSGCMYEANVRGYGRYIRLVRDGN